MISGNSASLPFVINNRVKEVVITLIFPAVTASTALCFLSDATIGLRSRFKNSRLLLFNNCRYCISVYISSSWHFSMARFRIDFAYFVAKRGLGIYSVCQFANVLILHSKFDLPLLVYQQGIKTT